MKIFTLNHDNTEVEEISIYENIWNIIQMLQVDFEIQLMMMMIMCDLFPVDVILQLFHILLPTDGSYIPICALERSDGWHMTGIRRTSR